MSEEKLIERYKKYEVSIEHKDDNITLVNFKPLKEMTPKEAFDFLEELREELRDYI